MGRKRRPYNNNKFKESKFDSKEPADPTGSEEVNGKKVVTKHRSQHNDAEWYTKSSQLVLDAGRLSFNVPLGSDVQWEAHSQVSSINNRKTDTYRLPGTMALSFIPTYGLTNYANDPLNIAARNIYSWIRHANSGSRNYDPNDLMLYLMAMDNCYMMYQHLVRIYGLARVFSQLNRHMPNTIFESLGVDWDNIVANLSNFRAYINMISAKLGSLCVPSDMPIFKRHMWMCAGIYQDAPSPKSQFYIFKPSFLGIYSERTSTTGGALMPQRVDTAQTYSDFVTIMNNLVNALAGSEDCGIISGDIRKAYGDNIITVSGISDDYVVIPTYRIEVLRQIQNATVFNGVNISSSGLIYQDLTDNILKSGLHMYVDNYMYAGNRILTGSDEQPTPEEVLESTRFMVTGECSVSTSAQSGGTASATNPYKLLFTPNSIGTEIITKAEIFGIKSTDWVTSANASVNLSYAQKYYANISTSGNRLANLLRFENVTALVENFNYHPRFGVINNEVIDENFAPTSQDVISYQDVDNYAVIGDEVLYNCHNTALMSLFDIPVMGIK